MKQSQETLMAHWPRLGYMSLSQLSLLVIFLILYSFFPKHTNYKLWMCKLYSIQFLILCASAFLAPLPCHFRYAQDGSKAGPYIVRITEK